MLLLPSANRVYASASPELAAAELAVFSESVLGGAPYGVQHGSRTAATRP
jgi:hypothetical protein